MDDKMEIKRYQLVLGWSAIGIVLIIASLWAYWGGIENFHEGWYSVSIWQNLLMMIMQYWLFALIFIFIGLLGIRFRVAALVFCVLLGIGAVIFFGRANFSVLWIMIVLPLAGLGLLFFFGRIRPRKIAYTIIVAIPVLILAVTTVIGLVRVSKRIDDGDYGIRRIETDSLCLFWAPRGPGWPDRGVSRLEAENICSHLSKDGSQLLEDEVNIWRLPTVEEAVRSQMLHGDNAAGIWDEDQKKASYDMTPDKETPLWDPHSMVIYYWTSDKESEDKAYIITYNGGVFARDVDSHYGYLSFRAVKECN